MAVQYFPLGIATGDNFCGRAAEQRLLREHIMAATHTWLAAPRRVGKTSLVEQVLLELRGERAPAVVSASTDLLMTYDDASFQEALLGAVGRLTARIQPKAEALRKAIRSAFTNLAPEVVLSTSGLTVRFPARGSSLKTADTIVAALEGLDRMAGAQQMRAVLALDEFQQLGTIRDHAPQEAAVRHAVERARNVTYLFLGSSRHLLGTMFEDPSRPLYHLCERLSLGMISAEEYEPFLSRKAAARWRKSLSDGALRALLDTTACHPYYVARLCRRLWLEPAPPTVEQVHATWEVFVRDEHTAIAAAVADLSPNQRAVLTALAETPTTEPRGQSFVGRTRLPGSSVSQAVQVLLEKDLVTRETDGTLRVLDPAIRTYLVDRA